MFRAYTPSDRLACLALFEGNSPFFFSEADRTDYHDFLDDADAGRETYFVLEGGAELLACGGVGQEAGETFLTWGMVRGDLRGAGLGSELTRYRLDWLRHHWPAASQVKIDTSQHTEGFYARFGFEVVEREQDGFGPGLDRVRMVARL